MGYVGYQEGIYLNRCCFFVYFDHKSFNFKSDLEIPSHGIKDFQSAAGRGWIRLRDPYSALFSQLGWMHRRSSNDHTSKKPLWHVLFFSFKEVQSISLRYTAILENLSICLGWRTNFADTSDGGVRFVSGWALSTIQRIHIQWLPMLFDPFKKLKAVHSIWSIEWPKVTAE